MERVIKMKRLKVKGLSYGSIGIIFKISRQRVHQLISGYITTTKRRRYWKKNKKINDIFNLIFERDNYTCQICEEKGTLIHHIDKDWENNNPNNLICLCNNCHLTLHRPKECSKEARKRISESQKGRKQSEETKKKISETRKRLFRENRLGG